MFTSDHGEYGGSHGLRGKGAGVYEEAIRVPLIVRDLRGQAHAAPAIDRTGLTSSVDIAPLLLTLATGSSAWRKDSRTRPLRGATTSRAMLSDPTAPGRPTVLHATDEILSEFATEPYAINAPLHVVAMRSAEGEVRALLQLDSAARTSIANRKGEERELYEYSIEQTGFLSWTTSPE